MRSLAFTIGCALLLGAMAVPIAAGAAQAPVSSAGVSVQAAQSTVVNMAELAREQSARPTPSGPGGARVIPLLPRPPKPDVGAPPFLPQLRPQAAGPGPQAPSPSPAQDFAGLDDIADLSTGYRYIPPDTDGAVGLTKVMSGLNNNYRIFTKATGAVVSTVSPETFWGSLGGSDFFDPKTLYDPIRDRWIVVMLSDPETAAASINIGVSQTSDPSGSYYLYRVDSDAANLTWADFPSIGFDGDYVAVNVNMFRNSNDNYVSSKVLAVDYAAMRTGTWHAWFLTGSLYSSSPAATYTAAESTLYVPVHWNSSPGSYRVDTITGDPATTGPVYTAGVVKSRGVSWTEPGGNILPQKTGAGGGTPLKIDAQDSEIRSTPVVRDGFIYYAQTVGLPSGGLSRTSILWTKLAASTGNVADGGLIDDPTATATNGGKWFAYTHVAANKYGDVIVGFSQFSSTQYASAGYAVHAASDPAGTMRDPVVYKAGEDVYQKTFSGTSNRWGDYSKAQVDPSNDADLWVLNEYAETITGSDDSGGRWGTWWGGVTAPSAPVITSIAVTAPTGTSSQAQGSALPVTWTTNAAVADGQFSLWVVVPRQRLVRGQDRRRRRHRQLRRQRRPERARRGRLPRLRLLPRQQRRPLGHLRLLAGHGRRDAPSSTPSPSPPRQAPAARPRAAPCRSPGPPTPPSPTASSASGWCPPPTAGTGARSSPPTAPPATPTAST